VVLEAKIDLSDFSNNLSLHSTYKETCMQHLGLRSNALPKYKRKKVTFIAGKMKMAYCEKENAEKSNNHGEIDNKPGIAVSYDMSWTKGAKGTTHSLVTEHQSMGLKTGKVLSYATRCKAFRVCESNKKSGKVAKTHACRKNHVGS